MSILFNCQNVSKSFGRGVLFEDLSLTISEGDRIGLIGLNGCGKSTFLKIVAGLENPDSGKISSKRGVKTAYVPQECTFGDILPKQVLIDALGDSVEEYEKERLALMQMENFGFKEDGVLASSLSGGWKKRLKIAEELIKEPDLLLLDEPTNHLDLEGILWLEEFLAKEVTGYLLVSHDRYFLQHATNKIVEIDKVYPEGVFIIDGSYKDFLFQKEKFLQGQIERQRSLAGQAKKETDWLRAGVKARTTKAQSRIDGAYEVIDELREVKKRNQMKTTKIDFVATDRETKKLITVTNLSKQLGGKLLFKNLDFTLSPGTRIGLMGPNGCGKTTLLKIIGEEIKADMGTLKMADDLKVVYFDQHRAKLNLKDTLKEALSPNGEFVNFRGNKVHINGWCQRFLFSPDLLNIPIGKLSGGERARITIAHLMLQPADVLLLDEPTNDLDIPTLETLEESLKDFPGAIVLISHDRCMLDRICNCVIGLGDGENTKVYSDYSQWEATLKPAKEPKAKGKKSSNSDSQKKEIEAIERKIEKLEEEIRSLNLQLEDQKISNDMQKISLICDKIHLAETKISELYLSWSELS
jgi:ATP-binding cassette subfamily F protein uup